jgi:HSP20 family protein
MTNLMPFRKISGFYPDRLFDAMDSLFSDAWTSKNSRAAFRLDIKEDESGYTVEAELPGVKKDEVSLELADNTLFISVLRRREDEDEKSGYIHRERRVSSMRRGIYLAESCGDGVEARLNDGILSVTVPKEPRPETKKIKIQ